MLVVGAIINIILDPIFIFVFNKGVAGGAIATVIGQFVSFLISIIYIKKFKSIKLKKESLKIDKDIFRVLGLGLSSCITQCTVLILFIFMNNMMTKLGATSKYGADIPLSVYGVISKINSIYISMVLGVSIGAQPIIGFNYGAGNKNRVKEILKKILIINFIIGIIFNAIYFFFPRELAGIFIKADDPSYELFMEFATLMCHSFYLLMGLNAFEMTGSISIQSLGKVKKATALSFIRQIILLIPISILLGIVLNKGLLGMVYAGCISDGICFIIALFMIGSEYISLGKKDYSSDKEEKVDNKDYKGKHIVITISREYA
jgi:Na+-driven multidrug efflux pump